VIHVFIVPVLQVPATGVARAWKLPIPDLGVSQSPVSEVVFDVAADVMMSPALVSTYTAVAEPGT
jgi:hypothetical protein